MIVLGVDIGGTKIAAGLVDDHGRMLDRITAPTPAKAGRSAIIETVCALGSTLIGRCPRPVAGCGIGSAGVIDPVDGHVVSATSALTGWAGTDLRGKLGQALGLPVSVINDVHAHALAEACYGAGVGARRMLLVALGTGVGGAFVRDGIVDRGRHGAAGHLGHVPTDFARGVPCTCGKPGHVEAVASGPAILEAYRAQPGAAGVRDTAEVFVRAARGDEVAAECIATAASAIGAAIGGFVNVFDPDVVVLSGGLAHAGDAWLAAIAEAARGSMIALCEDCPITVATLGVDAAIIGAATWQVEQRKAKP